MLSSKQRGYLSRLASAMDPVLMIGKDGVSDGVEDAFSRELHFRELMKVRFQASKDERFDLAAALAEKYQAELVRVIGNTAIFYKKSDDPEHRNIELPS
ncbi:MAG: YhbY family RNA-binding protein [Treponema sp.]|nr:YhbY family RNA-binding protein [Treponema sp.]